MHFKQHLEEMLNKMDHQFARSASRLKGRKVEASYKTVDVSEGEGKKKVDTKVRERTVVVMPYPSVFASRLSEVKNDFYGSGNKLGLMEKHNATKLAESQHGRRRFVTYFLHESEAASLLEDVAALNARIDAINRDVNRFESTAEFGELMRYLEAMVCDTTVWSRHPVQSKCRPIEVTFMPMPISSELIEAYTDPKVKAAIKKSVGDAAAAVAKTFQEQLGRWMEVLTTKLTLDVTDAEISGMRHFLTEIEANADKYNARMLVSRQLEVCESLISAIETHEPTALTAAANGVAALLQLQVKDDPKDTLKDAVAKIQKVDEVTMSFIDSLI